MMDNLMLDLLFLMFAMIVARAFHVNGMPKFAQGVGIAALLVLIGGHIDKTLFWIAFTGYSVLCWVGAYVLHRYQRG